MAYYVACSDCEGTDATCPYCDGKGYREERRRTDAELKAEVRFIERCLGEPMYQTAFLFLFDQKFARFRADIGRAA